MFVVTTPNLNNNDMFFTGIRDYFLWYSPRICSAQLFETEEQAWNAATECPIYSPIVVREVTPVELTEIRMTAVIGAAIRESLCALMDALQEGRQYTRITLQISQD